MFPPLYTTAPWAFGTVADGDKYKKLMCHPGEIEFASMNLPHDLPVLMMERRGFHQKL
jgi:hypothetical protein